MSSGHIMPDGEKCIAYNESTKDYDWCRFWYDTNSPKKETRNYCKLFNKNLECESLDSTKVYKCDECIKAKIEG